MSANTLTSIIEGVLNQPCKLRVKVTKLTGPVYLSTLPSKRKTLRPARKKQFLATNGGLMCCTVPEFDQATYKGLKQNCGRASKHPIKTRNKKTSHAL